MPSKSELQLAHFLSDARTDLARIEAEMSVHSNQASERYAELKRRRARKLKKIRALREQLLLVREPSLLG